MSRLLAGSPPIPSVSGESAEAYGTGIHPDTSVIIKPSRHASLGFPEANIRHVVDSLNPRLSNFLVVALYAGIRTSPESIKTLACPLTNKREMNLKIITMTN